MNNFHIYEEVGRGKDSVVYKVNQISPNKLTSSLTNQCIFLVFSYRVERRRLWSMLQSSLLKSLDAAKYSTR